MRGKSREIGVHESSPLRERPAERSVFKRNMGDSATQQAFDILDLERPGVIEASAGTGKTYSIAEIYLALLCGHTRYAQNPPKDFDFGRNPNPPSVREILVVTFTEAATNELTERLQKRIREAVKKELSPEASEKEKNERRLLRLADAEFDEAAVSTIHGFCMRVLRDFSFECGLPPALVPAENLTEEMTRFAARFRTREALLGNKRILELSTNDIRSIIDKLAKNPDIAIAEPDNGDRSDPDFHVATRGLKAWLIERKKIEQLSFDEVLLRLRDALRENPQLARKIAARYRVALVDEFQDTDPVQWEIFNLIFVRQKRPFFCVGDPKQAIYEFRGGDIRTYTQAVGEILRKNRDNRLRLITNWRSEATMIAAFNELFRADSQIEPTAQGVPVSGNLNYLDAVPAKRKEDSEKNVPAIFLRTGFSGAIEGARAKVRERLVEDIQILITKQKIPPEAIAVLTRKNNEAFAILRELTKKGVPAVMSATGSVLETEEASAIGEILDAMLNPSSTSAILRAAVCEFFGTSFFESLAQGGSGENEALSKLRERLFEAQKIWEQRDVLSAFSLLEKAYSFRENLAKLSEASRRLANATHILEILQTEAHQRRLAPQALFNRFSEMLRSPNPDSEKEALRIDSDAPAVQITTLHKSKGLQYEIVFLPSLWDMPINSGGSKVRCVRSQTQSGDRQILLRKNAAIQHAEIEETAQTHACLNYVAFTRAKKACVAYHANEATYRGKKIESYFSKILSAAGICGNATGNGEAKHWKILAEDDALPEILFLREKKSTARNSPDFLFPQNKPKNDAWGIFSFSKIIGDHETQNGKLEPETDDAEKSIDGTIQKSELFQAPDYYDLAAGKEFGTLVHAIFEQVDFKTRNNLDALIEFYRERFPQWLADDASRKKIRKMIDETLELPIDGKSAKLSQIDSTRDALRELEFLFHAKKSENLYSELNDVFSSWGGIYKRTAEIHWASGDAGTLKIEGLMHGYIDLVARKNGRYYIADWKTNRVMKKDERAMSRKNLEDEIAECGYALQWAIYAVALRKFLRKTLGDGYSTERNFGGIAYFFVRWNTVFFDNTLDDGKLDALENILSERNSR